MRINYIEISISDEDLGCQVTFSEKKDLGKNATNIMFKK